MDRETFLRPAPAPVKYELERGVVLIRSLSRPEAIEVAELAGDLPAQEKLTLRYGLVEPALTADEIADYYDQPGNIDEVQELVLAIQEVSLAGKGGAKSGVLGTGPEPGHGV